MIHLNWCLLNLFRHRNLQIIWSLLTSMPFVTQTCSKVIYFGFKDSLCLGETLKLFPCVYISSICWTDASQWGFLPLWICCTVNMNTQINCWCGWLQIAQLCMVVQYTDLHAHLQSVLLKVSCTVVVLTGDWSSYICRETVVFSASVNALAWNLPLLWGSLDWVDLKCQKLPHHLLVMTYPVCHCETTHHNRTWHLQVHLKKIKYHEKVQCQVFFSFNFDYWDLQFKKKSKKVFF